MTTLTHRNSDNASQLAYSGATDFNGVRNQEYPLIYNEAGSLVSDAGRNIANIEYDNLNNPVRIQFINGNVTKYVYSAAGEKLRVIYQTAVPNITVAMGSTRELTPYETLYTDSIDYLLGGALTLRNGKVDKYQFDEGYCQVSSSTSTTDTFILFYYEKDHLGNIRKVRKANRTRNGEVSREATTILSGQNSVIILLITQCNHTSTTARSSTNMHGLNTYDYGARQYNPVTARWDRVDPLAEKYYGISPYVYCANNPVRFVDMDGKEPIKMYAGTVSDFARLLNNSPRHVGKYRGQVAANYVKSLSDTEWNLSQFRPIPTQTPYFNKKKGRYIYTTKGGWLDMSHFMFYAGRAYNYKVQKEQAIKALSGPNYACLPEVRHSLEQQANMNPVSEAVQDGYHQELSDFFVAQQSAYSYEDLPSDKLGAFFCANVFDPNSELTFSEQLTNFLVKLGATNPENAPNFNQLPTTESDHPSRTNKSTLPVYTKSNP